MDIATPFLAAGVATATFTGTEIVAEQSEDILALAKPVLDAIRGGQWAPAAFLGLVLLVALARKYGKGRFPFLGTDAGGALLGLFAGFGVTGAAALAAGAAMSSGLLWTAFGAAVVAAGGYTYLAKLGLPAFDAFTSRMTAKFPKLAIGFVLANKGLHWLLDRQTSVQKAEQAGKDAVAAKPAQGIEGIAGKAEEIE